MSDKPRAGAVSDRRTSDMRTLSFIDIIERLPPSMIQLLTVLAPAIDVAHHALLLVTWRGGYAMRVQSWLLLVFYIELCLYGYELLRYAPQALILACLAYAWLRRTFARVTGKKRASDEQGSLGEIRRAIAQMADITDFVVAFYECFVRPVCDVLAWRVPGYGPVHLVLFLFLSWPLWILCMLPSGMWVTPMYTLRAEWASWTESGPARWVCDVAHAVGAALAKHLAENSPRLWHVITVGGDWANLHVVPRAMRAVAWLLQPHSFVSIQVWPPFPIASLSVRHVMLVGGVIVLTWCSPWGTLLRMAIWRSALVRRATKTIVHVLSGSESLAASIPAPQKRSKRQKASASHETEFVFEIYENQRWWIGLDWTAALLPQERPSWSDSDNEAVAPPASFSLPRSTRVMMPSSRVAGKQDCRKSEWRWIDSEWHVAGVQTITSETYTPAERVEPSEVERLSTELADKTAKTAEHMEARRENDALAQVADAASATTTTVPETVPADVRRYARMASEPGVSMDVDAEGWQYGDNAWDKLSKQNGIGRYTRRRRWLRRAVLIESVEYGV